MGGGGGGACGHLAFWPPIPIPNHNYYYFFLFFFTTAKFISIFFSFKSIKLFENYVSYHNKTLFLVLCKLFPITQLKAKEYCWTGWKFSHINLFQITCTRRQWGDACSARILRNRNDRSHWKLHKQEANTRWRYLALRFRERSAIGATDLTKSFISFISVNENIIEYSGNMSKND